MQVKTLMYIFIILGFLFLSYVVGLWTQSNINYWLLYNGGEDTCPLWLAWLLSVVLNAFIVALNLASELAEIFFKVGKQ